MLSSSAVATAGFLLLLLQVLMLLLLLLALLLPMLLLLLLLLLLLPMLLDQFLPSSKIILHADEAKPYTKLPCVPDTAKMHKCRLQICNIGVTAEMHTGRISGYAGCSSNT